jgi:competence protein ComEA
LVDVNRADAATLATIPGIGAGLAERIVAFRSTNGPFASPDELLDVSGITDRRLEALLPYVVAR